MAEAMFGAGCFWGVEAAFRQLPGVRDAAVGYSGGTVKNPSYKDVCSGRTGHAEVVWIDYDPDVIRYERLLETFWSCHNPTTLNRQGPDIGTQYRSAVYYFDEAQRAAAEAAKRALDTSRKYPSPVITEIAPAGPFYRAEDSHQRYFEKQGISHCPR